MLLLALGVACAVDTASIEAASRALTAGAATDTRFDVVSQLDVQDTLALEANKQLCDVESSVCAEELLGAFDARFVVFSNLYEVAGARRLAITVRDLRSSTVVARDDIAADGDFFGAASAAAARAVHAIAGQPAERRLFVVRTTAEAAPAATSSSSVWPTTTIAGAALLALGGLTGLGANVALTSEDLERSNKDIAFVARPVGYVVAGVGAVVTLVGVGGLLLGGE